MNEQKPDPEAMVEIYLKHGETDKAFELLFKLALWNAKKKDFVKAETFRDRLYEVDSFALSRIVEINELIESEKSKSITTDDRKLWSRFFEGLSPSEANAFFLHLRKEEMESKGGWLYHLSGRPPEM